MKMIIPGIGPVEIAEPDPQVAAIAQAFAAALQPVIVRLNNIQALTDWLVRMECGIKSRAEVRQVFKDFDDTQNVAQILESREAGPPPDGKVRENGESAH